MPNRFRLLRCMSAASVLGVVAVPAQGQRQGADDNQLIPPTFRTEANYVRMDVFVTRDGEPVMDLRPEEFQILDEGVPQEITQFEYIRIRGNVPQVDVILTTPDGETVSTRRARLEAGTRRFEVAIEADNLLMPGDYTVRVRARGRAVGSLSTSDAVTVSLPAAPGGAGARIFRRGPVTGNQEVATADLRFRRSERLRIHVPGQAGVVPSAILLDRTGAQLAVPVEAGVHDAGDGTWWVTAAVVLAPLATGDYVLEISGASPSDGSTESPQIWTGFRIVR